MINKEETLVQAIGKFGKLTQLVVTTEELSELIKEVTKQIRGIGKRENLIEEMADVTIMLEQLKIMYSISESELEDEINFKTLRLNRRIMGTDYDE